MYKIKDNIRRYIMQDKNQNLRDSKAMRIINQSAIARELNISSSYVSKILLGKRRSKKYEIKIRELIKKAADELRAA